jgi:hypothetical protein
VDAGVRPDAGVVVDAGTDAGTPIDAGTPVDAGSPIDAGVCVPSSCTAAGASCGAISDGCGRMLNCGICAMGAACQEGRCVCAAGTTELCGDGVDNNCDGNIDCIDPQCSGLMACAQPVCTVTTPEQQITAPPSNAYGVFILSTPSGWTVFTHEDTGNVNLRYSMIRLSPSLSTLGSSAVTAIGAAHRPYAAWSGSEFATAFSDSLQGGTMSNDVFFTRVSATGQRMLSSDVPISVRPGIAFPASIAFNSTANEYGVLWGDAQTMPPIGTDRGLSFRRVSAQGQLQGSEVAITPTRQGLTTDYSDITWGGTNYGIVATQIRPGNVPFMLFNRLTSAGSPELADVQLNTSGLGAYQPRIGSSPTQYGMVFEELPNPLSLDADIIFVRADKQGPANTQRLAVTTSRRGKTPSVLWAGGKWLVAFADTRSGRSRIYLAKFAADGTRLGSDELVSCVTQDAFFPHLATDGAQVAVAFVARGSGTGPTQAFVKQFTP